MFGGLTKTSSRIAIAAALGFTFGGLALSAPANAGGFGVGGDCCADLEERVAELEATTVRKGNKKVSVTLSGWVLESFNWWDDGSLSDSWIGTKDADLGTRFAITGSATIAPGWSGGYNITVTTPGNIFGGFNAAGMAGNNFGIFSSQFAQDSLSLASIQTLYSYMFIKSDDWGTINLGYLSPASDNTTFLTDISGSVIESNPAFFEGGGYVLRAKGAASGFGGLVGNGLTWGTFLNCNMVGPIGADCFGAPQNGVRYDSPTFGGFRMEAGFSNTYSNAFRAGTTFEAPEVWDLAVIYNDDWWDTWKVSAAYSYTNTNGNLFSVDQSGQIDIHQVGATIMHSPSGLGVYGYYNYEDNDGNYVNQFSRRGNIRTSNIGSWDSFFVKPFIKRTWNPLGSTLLWGEYGRYNDAFNGILGGSQCGNFAGAGLAGTNAAAYCGTAFGNGLFVTGSEIERYGLGVVQEIDAAAMHVFARWQHQEADIDFQGYNAITNTTTAVSQGFDDLDIFQLGGIIFF